MCIYKYIPMCTSVNITVRSKHAGYEIDWFGKSAQPSQGEHRIPRHTQGGRRKLGSYILYVCVFVCACTYKHTSIYIHIYVSISISDRTDAAVSGFRERARQTSHLRHGKTVTCNPVPLASLMSPSQLGGKKLTCGGGV